MNAKDNRVALGVRIKEAREYRGFSQEEVAKYLKVSRSAVSLIESGTRGLDVMELHQLVTLFGCAIEELSGKRVPAANTQLEEPESIKMVARATAALSPEDRSEVLRFVQFLQNKKTKKRT